MFKIKGDKKQKFSLRSYKGIGAASVLVGVLALSGGVASAHEGLVDNGDGTTTISNDKGSIKLKSSHVTVSTKVGDGTNNIDANAILEKEKGILKTEEAKISDKSTETFRKEGNVDVKYVTGDGVEIKEKSEVSVDKVLGGSLDKTVNSEIHGDFGKVIKDGADQGTSKISVEKVEVENLSPKTIIKDDKTYHFVNRIVNEKDYNYSKDIAFGDVTEKVTVDGLHRNDGSVKFDNIKDGSKLWLVEELANNKYGRYLTVTKTSDMNEDKVIEILKSGLNGTKIFNKINVDADGGIKNDDYLMFFERNTFARVDKRVIGEPNSGAVGDLNDENTFNDSTGYALLYNITKVNGTGKIKEDVDRSIVLEKINNGSSTSFVAVDGLGRPVSDYKYAIKGAIGNKVYESFEEFKNDVLKTPVFLKDFSTVNADGGYSIGDDGDSKKRLLLEPTFSDHVLTNDELIELNKNTLNNYANYKSGDIDKNYSGLNTIVDNHNKAINFRKNIVYDKSPMLDKVDFDRYIIEYNAKLVDQKIYDDSIRYGFYTDLREGEGTTYKIYGQYTENGVVHRAPINVKNPFYVTEGIEGLKEVQYNDIYSVNRVYRVIDGDVGERSVVTNIYNEELSEKVAEKGHVKVKYVDEAGVEILGSKITDEKDASVTIKKYYLDKDGVKQDVSSDKLTENTPYDVSGFEYKPLGINKSDASYVFSRLDGKEQGVLEPGEKTVTFIYKKVEPKVITEVIEPTVTYTGDTTRDVGSEDVTEVGTKGSKVTTTTYTVNEKTGEVIAHVGEPVITKAGTTVVKVGAKPTVVTTHTEPTVVYEPDVTRDRGTPDEKVLGTRGTTIVTTTYKVDAVTGDVTEVKGQPIVTPATNTIVRVGVKDKVELIKGNGKTVEKRTVYTLDRGTGKVTEKITMTELKVDVTYKADDNLDYGKRVVSDDGSVVTIGTKPTELVEVIEPEIVYEVDLTREKGLADLVTKGIAGKKVTTIKYSVDEKTGVITDERQEPVITPATKTIVKVAAQPHVVTTTIPRGKVYVADNKRDFGTDNVVVDGKDGVSITTTSYNVDPTTGVVTGTTGKPVVTEPTMTMVYVGAKSSVKEVKGDDGLTYEELTEYSVDKDTGVVTPKVTRKLKGNTSEGPVDTPKVDEPKQDIPTIEKPKVDEPINSVPSGLKGENLRPDNTLVGDDRPPYLEKKLTLNSPVFEGKYKTLPKAGLDSTNTMVGAIALIGIAGFLGHRKFKKKN